MASYLINHVPNIENKRYLELGIYKGSTFRSVTAKNKVSVDLNEPAMFQMTTDAFFTQLDKNEKFDVIYIDACHQYLNVVRDFNNSISHLSKNGLIFVHDLIPPTEEFTAPHYCGDGYKFLYHLIVNHPGQFKHYSLAISQGDYGLTVFVDPRRKVVPTADIATVSYQQFRKVLLEQQLHTKDEIKQILGELS